MGTGLVAFLLAKKPLTPSPLALPSLSKHPHISNTERSQKSVTVVSV